MNSKYFINIHILKNGLIFIIMLLVSKAASFSIGPTKATITSSCTHINNPKRREKLQLQTRTFPLDFSGIEESEILKIENVIRECATQRSVDASVVISTLEKIENTCSNNNPFNNSVDENVIGGKFELIFSSAVANLPILGSVFGGYMPNKEIITFDLEEKQMSLIVELLPFLPTIDIFGDSLQFNKETGIIEYTIRGKEEQPPSKWHILYADNNVVAARSSVTGLNVIRRV